MNIPPRFTVSESSHRLMNPVTIEQIDEFGRALRLGPGMTVLDLASGKGEMLCRWAKHHGISGVGVELHPPFHEDALSRAAELGVEDQVRSVLGDATEYVADTPFDVVSCLGATWIGGGFAGTVELLERSLSPGGLMLIGDVYWRELPPTDEAVRGCDAESFDDFATQDDIVERIHAAGYDLVEMLSADQYSWERYAAPTWFNMRQFLDAHPDHELAPELRHLLDTEPLKFLRYQRRYLGWSIFAMKKR